MNLIKYYRVINILSIDIALGAVVCTFFLGKALGIEPSLVPALCLGVTVWIIYTADHLLDARRIPGIASTLRHRFHQENFRAILFGFTVAMVLNFIFLFFVGRVVLLFGGILTLLVCLYFLFQHHLSFMKEGAGAILYTAGVILPIFSKSTIWDSSYKWSLITMFTLTALVNLILFSWFDMEHDKNDNQSSLAVRIGKAKTSTFLYLLFAGQLVTAILTITTAGSVTLPLIVIAMMNVILFLIFRNSEVFSESDGYRMAGDAVFIFPILFFSFL